MEITPTLATEILTLGFAIRDAIAARLKAKHGADYQPTDAEMLAELQANADAVLSEGAAWKAAHP